MRFIRHLVTRRHAAATVAIVAMAALAPGAAHAQIEAGQVVDDSTHAPLAHTRVALQQRVAGEWKVVDTTLTDQRGLFQFALGGPGTYRVGIGGITTPAFVGGADSLVADSMQQRRYEVPVMRTIGTRVFYSDQVDDGAMLVDRHADPAYPPALRAAGISGAVVAQYVVNADGHVDMTSFRVIASKDSAFTDAVRAYLPHVQFRPGTIAGFPVRQLVQSTFSFGIGKP